ncbi:MAG: Nif3-like dinuclear metal center hexameric protein [Candidatus Cloacimonetes bacterium]|nr:Nif3-like dinuclear metal center hexameric protein [Candidatus Cloacimonadota bacterium]
MIKVVNFYNKLNEIAPFASAYSWDNCGLLIGDMEREVHKVLISLDITDKIADYAIYHKIDLIISHHPIIYQAMKSICQKKYLKLIENKISVISAHTNLDVSKLGVNYVLAEKLGLQNIKTLNMSNDINQYQICVYIPIEYHIKVMTAMTESGAGHIDNYSHCATYFETLGQYMPLSNSKPYQGEINKLEKNKEVKLELLCEEINLQKVIKALFDNHPYETPVYAVIPLKQSSPNYGLGCFGELSRSETIAYNNNEKMTLKDFSHFVKAKLNAPFVKLWLAGENKNMLINNVAVCGGSGNSLIYEAKRKADVYVSSEFSYHQLLDAPMPIIDAGHFFTENPIVERLKDIFKDFECEILTLDHQEHDIKKLILI